MQTIGIDLGTTNSLVTVMEDGRPRVLANELGDLLTPSVVAVAEDGSLLVGRAAKDRLITEPSAGKAHFKRDMGSEARYDFGGKQFSPVECSAVVIRELKRIAEMQLNTTITDAVITVPAYFHDQQRQATVEAAKLSGLGLSRVINEPTAAALAYGYANPDEETTLLVFDIGGGTFDVTLLEIFDGVIEVKASAGESHLGGEDYTDIFLQKICEKYELEQDEITLARWRPLVEAAKRRLADKEETLLDLGGKEITVSQNQFRDFTKDLTARLRPVITRCLRDGGTQFNELDDILLVGGASRMGIVLDLLRADLGRFPNQVLDADLVVGMGAGVQAALCNDDVAVQDIVLTDVSPHTLGIEVTKEIAPNRNEEGFFSPIIDRNTTIPTSRSDVFHTLHPDQDEIHLQIFQGEARKVKDNKRIGDIRINGLRKKNNQLEPGTIEVRFSYDMNGILEIEVTVKSTGKKLTKVIEQRPGALSRAEIKEALKRLAPLKTHPRDLLPNRTKIERANRLFTELVGPERARLDQALSSFEAALDQQDDEGVKYTGAILEQIFEHYFGNDDENRPEAPDES